MIQVKSLGSQLLLLMCVCDNIGYLSYPLLTGSKWVGMNLIPISVNIKEVIIKT